MSATEIISEIKRLPQTQQQKVYKFVDEKLREAEDRHDNAAARRALAEPGENIPWNEASKRLGWA